MKKQASEIVKKVTLPTKLVNSEYLSQQTGGRIYLKTENMQYTGAYKVRGSYYKISTLRRRTRKRTDHCFRRKPCAGSCLCSVQIRV